VADYFIVKLRRIKGPRYNNYMSMLPSWWAEPALAEGKTHVMTTLDERDRLVLTALTHEEAQRLRKGR
jgi:hypothetical protein